MFSPAMEPIELQNPDGNEAHWLILRVGYMVSERSQD